ncbi:DnaJ family molecular chaperone [Fibrobacterota bacterium]
MRKYYEILAIPEEADAETIEKAYYKCCKSYHPDKLSHLGAEFQSLASAKMTLINEAYRILRDPENRKKYNQNPALFHSSGFFAICRFCGYSSWTSDYIGLKSISCPSCGRSFESQLRSTGHHLWDDFKPLLYFLDLSHRNLSDFQISSAIQFFYQKSPVVLDCMPDGKWCLFTQSKAMHQCWRQIHPSWVKKWDSALNVGFCIVSDSTIPVMADIFLKLIHGIQSECLPQAVITPTDRKEGVAEPNTLLLSALADKCIVQARNIWRSSGGNLFACDFELEPGWEERLEQLFAMVYESRRKERKPELQSVLPVQT